MILSADNSAKVNQYLKQLDLHKNYAFLIWGYGITLIMSLAMSIIANKKFFLTIQSWCAKVLLSPIFFIILPLSLSLNLLAIITFFSGGLVFFGIRSKRKYEKQSSFNKKMWRAFVINMFLTFFVIRWFMHNVLLKFCERHLFW